jgi:DNA-binding PadR family transcriptional regulator
MKKAMGYGLSMRELTAITITWNYVMPNELNALLPLKPNDYHILLTLADSPRHGYWIAKEIRRETNDKIRLEAGNLHRTLQKMVRQELVERTPAPADDDDPRRNYYGITPLGKQALAADTARMRELLASVDGSGVLEGA